MFDPKAHMTDLRGRDYLEVKWRLVWFRDDHPNGLIDTEIVNTENLTIRASIFDEDGRKLATGHGSANADGKRVVWTGREIEKAETAAIGRALAHAGYGTQFTGEDEGDNLADSPVEKPAPAKTNGAPKASTKTPAKWKPDAIKWMVENEYAENQFNAEAMWNLLQLDTVASKSAAVSRVKKYREMRLDGVEKEFAVEHALKA